MLEKIRVPKTRTQQSLDYVCKVGVGLLPLSLSLSWQYHLNPELKKIKQPHDNYIQPSNSVCLTLISRVAINLKEFLNDQIKVETLKHWEFRNGVFNNLSAMIANLSLKWQFHLTQDIINSRSYNNIIFNPATHFSSDGIAELQSTSRHLWMINNNINIRNSENENSTLSQVWLQNFGVDLLPLSLSLSNSNATSTKK